MSALKVVKIDDLWDDRSEKEQLARFREQDVEFLLDQSADLLDRILRDQAAFDDLGEKLFEITIFEEQLKEYRASRELALPLGYAGNPPTIVNKQESLTLEEMTSKASNEESLAYVEALNRIVERNTVFPELRAPFENPGRRALETQYTGVANAGNNNPADQRYEGARLTRQSYMRRASPSRMKMR